MCAARAIIGGVDYAVGGWAAYEIDRRHERYAASRHNGGAIEVPGKHYGGRSYIHSRDIVQSVLGGAESILAKAASRFADALARLEDRLCEPDEDGVWECATSPKNRTLTAPALTSVDVREFAADTAHQADPDALAEMGEDVLTVAAVLGAPLVDMPAISRDKLPPLPHRMVAVSDDAAVIRLEAATVPYVTSVEELQAALANRFEAATAVVEAAVSRRGK